MKFNKQVLNLAVAAETERIVGFMRQYARQTLRRGGVVGISGGIDSAVVLALMVRAFTPRNVVAVMMPDKDSDPVSEIYARELAAEFGVTPVLENISGALTGFDCYRRRDDAIRRVVPEYDAAQGFKAKIVLPSDLLDGGTLNVFSVTVIFPDGHQETHPLPPREMLEIIAATNLKQRSRMAMLYVHAESRQYAVIGTANKNEHDQGFFVKYGDGGADLQPIAHLFKTQIYQLAQHFGIPESIQKRTPTTDTYSAPCNQQEFFYRLPFETLDLIWFGLEHQVPAAEVGQVLGLTKAQVQHAFEDIQRKQRTTEYLRMPPPVLTAPAHEP